MKSKIIIRATPNFTIVISIIVSVLLMFNKIYDYNIVGYIGIIIAVIYTIIGSDKQSAMFIISLCPAANYLFVGSHSVFSYLPAIYCIKNLKVMRKKQMGLPVFALILFILSCFASMFSYSDYSMLASFLKLATFFVMMMIVAQKTYKTQEYVLAYSQGAFVVAIIGILYTYIINGNFIGTTINDRRFRGLFDDPNYYGAVMVFAIILILIQINDENKEISSIVKILILGMSGLLTLSMGFLFSLSLTLLLLFIFMLQSNRLSWKGILLFGFVIILIILIMITSNRLTNLIQFRIGSSINTGGSGRLDTWEWYIRDFIAHSNSWLFGRANAFSMVNIGNVRYVTHNTILQLIYEFGISGLICFIFLLKQCLNLFKTDNKRESIYILPLIATLSAHFFIEALVEANFIYTLLLGLLIFERGIKED